MRSYFRTFFEYGFGSNLVRYTDPDPQPWTLCGQWKSFVRESLFCNLALIPLQSKEHLSLPGWSPSRDGPDIKFSGYPATRYLSWCLISGRMSFFSVKKNPVGCRIFGRVSGWTWPDSEFKIMQLTGYSGHPYNSLTQFNAISELSRYNKCLEEIELPFSLHSSATLGKKPTY